MHISILIHYKCLFKWKKARIIGIAIKQKVCIGYCNLGICLYFFIADKQDSRK